MARGVRSVVAVKALPEEIDDETFANVASTPDVGSVRLVVDVKVNVNGNAPVVVKPPLKLKV